MFPCGIEVRVPYSLETAQKPADQPNRTTLCTTCVNEGPLKPYFNALLLSPFQPTPSENILKILSSIPQKQGPFSDELKEGTVPTADLCDTVRQTAAKLRSG
eukprot:gene19911-biopygen6386